VLQGDDSLFQSGHVQRFEKEAGQVADSSGSPQAVLQVEGVVDGLPEQGGDVGHGVEFDRFSLTDGADVTAVTGTPTFAAGLAALGGLGRVVMEKETGRQGERERGRMDDGGGREVGATLAGGLDGASLV